MTRKEFRAAIDSLSEEDLREANERLHLDPDRNPDKEKSKDAMERKYTAYYRVKPDFEASCVEFLQEKGCDVQTEQQKLIEAAGRSAKATEASAKWAKWVFWCLVITALIALAVGVLNLLLR